MSAGGDREETVAGSADLVVRNGRIHTGDPAHPSATDVAVRDGRIAAIGEAADVALLVGPATRVVDALGRRVIPGLNDSHLHVIRGGLNYLLELRWDGLPTLRQGLAMLREQAARTPKGQWLRVVGGWSVDQFVERRLPTISELNAVAPETSRFVPTVPRLPASHQWLDGCTYRDYGNDRRHEAAQGTEASGHKAFMRF